jgi:hypothetical protein
MLDVRRSRAIELKYPGDKDQLLQRYVGVNVCAASHIRPSEVGLS